VEHDQESSDFPFQKPVIGSLKKSSRRSLTQVRSRLRKSEDFVCVKPKTVQINLYLGFGDDVIGDLEWVSAIVGGELRLYLAVRERKRLTNRSHPFSMSCEILLKVPRSLADD
jgi:hypothetical protein